MAGFFSKKNSSLEKFMRRDCCIWGGGGLMIISCQGTRLNTVSLFPNNVGIFTWKLNCEWTFEGFILGLRVKKEVSELVPCSVFLMLILNWGFNILFEILTPEIRGWIWKPLFAHYALSPFLISLVVTWTFMPWL